jgi:potassium-transporting ATPase KdpC subunit
MLQKHLRIASVLFVTFTFVTGICYPMLVTGIAHLCFPGQANGSILTRNGTPVGSELIGQQFTSPSYFRTRPSATGPFPYNAAASSGSNLAPLNPALKARVREDVDNLARMDTIRHGPIPVDLVTTSASGLDPHISPAAAHMQVSRVAGARDLPEPFLHAFVDAHTDGRFLGIFGEPRVNVLVLNLALDSLTTLHERR